VLVPDSFDLVRARNQRDVVLIKVVASVLRLELAPNVRVRYGFDLFNDQFGIEKAFHDVAPTLSFTFWLSRVAAIVA
jgi:hypothetical protein